MWTFHRRKFNQWIYAVVFLEALIHTLAQDEPHYHGQDGQYDHGNDGSGWDIRLSVPGEPEIDYPVFSDIPITSFTCDGRLPGYYADYEARCQVFRVCANTAIGGFFSFLCPNGTLFNQEVQVCDWWTNVRCQDLGVFVEGERLVTVKSGDALVKDIRKMIAFPMTNPYTGNREIKQMTIQEYNPPEDMMSAVAFAGGIKETNGIDGFVSEYKLPGPPIGFLAERSQQRNDAVDSLARTKTDGFFTADNFKGLAVNQGNPNGRAITITKQQFTYPSQYDKEYTFTVPKLPLPAPFVVRFPINVPAIDVANGQTVSRNDAIASNYQGYDLATDSNRYFDQSKAILAQRALQSASLQGINVPKSLPIIVLFLQPPHESQPQLTPSVQSNHLQANTAYQKQYNHDSVKGATTSSKVVSFTKSGNIKSQNSSHALLKNHRMDDSYASSKLNSSQYRQNIIKTKSRHSTNESSLTNNYAVDQKTSKTNTVVVEAHPDHSQKQINENVVLDHGQVQEINHESDKDDDVHHQVEHEITYHVPVEHHDEHHVEEHVVHHDATDNDDNKNLVTLFSAHIIPGGDTSKQKVFKICIPKNILSYLVHLHNTTKAALVSTYQNEINTLRSLRDTNASVLVHSPPLIRKIVEKMFLHDQQVPIVTGEEFYLQQKYFNQNSDNRLRNLSSEFSKNQSGNLQQVQQNSTYPEYIVQLPEDINNYKQIIEASQKGAVSNSIQDNKSAKLQHEQKTVQFNANINSAKSDNIINHGYKESVIAYHQNFSGSQPQQVSGFVSEQSYVSHPVQENKQNLEQRKQTESDQIQQIKQSDHSTKQNHQQNTVYFIESHGHHAQEEDYEDGHFISVQQYSAKKPQPTVATPSNGYAQYRITSTQAVIPQHKENVIVYAKDVKNTYPEAPANIKISSQQFSIEPTFQTIHSTVGTTVSNHKYENQIKSAHVENKINNDNYKGAYVQQLVVPTQTTVTFRQETDGDHDGQHAYVQHADRNRLVSQMVTHHSNEDKQYSFQQAKVKEENYVQQAQRQSHYDTGYQQHNEVKHQDHSGGVVVKNVYKDNVQSVINNNVHNKMNYDTSGHAVHHDNAIYTTVEVVPALGFALNTDHERQNYYASLAQRYGKTYHVPEHQQVVTYSQTVQREQPPVVQAPQREYYNMAGYQNAKNYDRFRPDHSQFGAQKRIVHGQVIMHSVPQQINNMQQKSMPIEDLGYPRERPSVAFTFR